MIVRSVYHEGTIAESRKYWFYFVAIPGYLFLDFVTVPRFFPNVSVNICLENNTSTPQRAFPLELQIVKVLNCHECDIVGTVGSALSGHGGEAVCLWPPQPWQWAHLLAARGQPKEPVYIEYTNLLLQVSPVTTHNSIWLRFLLFWRNQIAVFSSMK